MPICRAPAERLAGSVRKLEESSWLCTTSQLPAYLGQLFVCAAGLLLEQGCCSAAAYAAPSWGSVVRKHSPVWQPLWQPTRRAVPGGSARRAPVSAGVAAARLAAGHDAAHDDQHSVEQDHGSQLFYWALFVEVSRPARVVGAEARPVGAARRTALPARRLHPFPLQVSSRRPCSRLAPVSH